MASATHRAKAKLAAARAVAQNLPVPMTAGCCAEHAKVGLGWRYGSLNVWSVCRRSSLSHTKGVGGRKAHATILVPQPALHPGRPLDAVSTTAQARSDGGLTAGRADLAGFFRRPRSAGSFTALVASSSELVHAPTPFLRRRPFQRPPHPGKGPGSIQATLGPAFDGYALRRWYVVRPPAPG